MTLDYVVSSLKERFSLIDVNLYPPEYQRLGRIEPLFRLGPCQLDIIYDGGHHVQVHDDIGQVRMYLFTARRLGAELPAIPSQWGTLREIAAVARERNCDILYAYISSKYVLNFICDLIAYEDTKEDAKRELSTSAEPRLRTS